MQSQPSTLDTVRDGLSSHMIIIILFYIYLSLTCQCNKNICNLSLEKAEMFCEILNTRLMPLVAGCVRSFKMISN